MNTVKRIIDRLSKLGLMCFVCLQLIFTSHIVQAQEGPVSNNVELLGHLEYPSGANDIWGYTDGTGKEYALIGIIPGGTAIVDVTDPTNPTEVAFIPGPPSVWRDIRTHLNFAYVTTEGSGAGEGLQIIDLTDPENAFLAATFDGTFTTAHNLHIDDGFAYVVGTVGPALGMHVLDLSVPDNPVEVGRYSDLYVHDVYVQNDLAYASAIGNGSLEILDISDKSNIVTLASVPSPDAAVHNAWTTEDGQFVLTTDETLDGHLRIWDVSDLSNITQVAEYESRDQIIIHNVTVREDYAFISYYIDGLKVVDLSDPTNPGEVGFYDTFPAESRNPFDGNWGVYPFAPSGNIYVSDISTGLYILDFNEGVRSGGVSGVITDKSTGMPIAAAEVNFAEAGKTLITDGAGVYTIRTNEGHHTVTATAFGFLPETAEVDVAAGPGAAELNISLDVNTAALDVSEESLKLELEVGETGQKALIISNVGGGILNFEVDDIAGPFESESNSSAFSEDLSLQFNWDISKIKSAVAKGSAIRKEARETARMSHLSRNLMLPSSDLEEIISDPAGDILGDPAFTKPDIVGLFADFDDVAVTFQFVFNEDVDTSSTVILLSLDTDQDIETGAFPPASVLGAPNTPAHDIGSEFELIWDVSDIFGTGGGVLVLTFDGNFMGIVPMDVSSNMVTASIPLSILRNDDGNMNVTSLALTFPGAPALDFAPDAGHGTVGIDVGADVPWLSVSPTSGSLQRGEAQEITVNFDASGLPADTTLAAEILVEVFGVAIAPRVISVELTITQPTEEISVTFGDGAKVDFSGVASDAYLDKHKDDFNTGTTHFLRVGNDGLPGKRPNRSLIKFDFTPGLMAAGVTDSDQILDAWIDLRVFSSEGAGEDGLSVDIFKVNKDWNEGATDYAPAAVGEVTWNSAKHDEKKWSTAGASHVSKDREKRPDDTEHIDSPGRVRFNVKSTIKDMFESGNNFGLLLQAQDESKDKYYRIYSSEHRKTKRRPKLTIVARVPDNNVSASSEIDRVELRATNSPRPVSFGLQQNYPNPFNPETMISFNLPKGSHVVVKIFNTLGQEIRTLVDAPYQAGYHNVGWNGTDRNGNQVASGVYLYRIKAGDFMAVKKMSLLR